MASLNISHFSMEVDSTTALESADINTVDPSRAVVEPLLSNAQRQVADDILLLIRYIAVVLALPLTFCNIVVFLHKDMRSATAVYVTALSVAQFVYVTVSTLQNLFYRTFKDPMSDVSYWAFNLYATVYCGIIARRGSYAVMCLVSLERLYAIVRPLHIKTFFLHRRPLVSVLSTYIITALFHIYILAKTEIKAVGVTPTGSVAYKPVPTVLYLQHKNINDAFSLAAKIILTYSALVILIGLNILTIFFLRRHSVASSLVQSSAKEEDRRRRERQMTVTILAATVSYVVLSLPSALHNLVYTLIPQSYGIFGTFRNLYAVVANLALDLSVFSCGVDFVCFILLSSSYRQTAFKLLGRKVNVKTLTGGETGMRQTGLQTAE